MDHFNTLIAETATVEVFKTNVHNIKQANRLILRLSCRFPLCEINFDLEDCDRILRVAGYKVNAQQVVLAMQVFGFECSAL